MRAEDKRHAIHAKARFPILNYFLYSVVESKDGFCLKLGELAMQQPPLQCICLAHPIN
jgi:hypothetical protein